MKLAAILLAYLICALVAPSATTGNATKDLSLLITITRHGARTPVQLFAGDPNNDFWTDGLGQLTNPGKQQLYGMGQSIRDRYKGFLSKQYMPEEIKIKSTSMDRTIMSAQCFLAGLYPPKGTQVWNPDLDWQPIPVYLLDYDVNKIFGDAQARMYASCLASPGKNPDLVFNQYKWIIQKIEAATGISYACLLSDFFMLLDAFVVEKFHNLTLPFGLDSHYSTISDLKDAAMVRSFALPEMSSISNAPILNEVVQVIEAHNNGSSSQKAFTYFMHDANIIALLSSLTEAHLKSPEFAASLTFELYEKNGVYSVKLLHQKSPLSAVEVQTIKNCGTTCPLDAFIAIVKTVATPPATIPCPC